MMDWRKLKVMDPAVCPDCQVARQRRTGLINFACRGCRARDIASGPQAFAGINNPAHADPLKALVRENFERADYAWAATAIREWFALWKPA
jgi:ribosomal protein L37AE/L43A